MFKRYSTKRLVRYISSRTGIASDPFQNASKRSIQETLETDPNLEGFLVNDTSSQTQNAEQENDPFDFSDLPQLRNIPSFMENLEPGQIYSKDQLPLPSKDQPPESKIPNNNDIELTSQSETQLQELIRDYIDYELFQEFLTFMHYGDYYTHPKPTMSLTEFLKSSTPVVVFSKFTNPYINLALEMFIYDTMPLPHQRLLFYKNNSCIVIGKNQNPYKEINLNYANTTQTPILRRYSGGGTVVHDQGNLNFSFMSTKKDFHRTAFTSNIISRVNELIFKEHPMGFTVNVDKIEWDSKFVGLPKFRLSTNGKGDIVSEKDSYKISGSAFKLSKGKSLHHGTLLMNSDLKELGKLLRVSEARQKSIHFTGTESIRSKVKNLGIDPDLFMFESLKAFIEMHGHESHAIQLPNAFESDGKYCRTIVVDDLDHLPQSVWDYYNELKSWDWNFGRTPKFQHTISHHDFECILHVNKGMVTSFDLNILNETSSDFIHQAFSSLLTAIEKEPMKYQGRILSKYIQDQVISDWLKWEVDFGIAYENVGCETTSGK
ncbi:BA75_04626T0 [Komagataella pastoris]|uniref:Putative lipoate-protein ligase A n=1 Tax=Komagataella pastoris TaxID=4922 RepID=A0A1B2JI33_PICPA|nr:BA75_04626T0 [Komagataella pastoris]